MPEPSIETFSLTLLDGSKRYLIPSPELHMKPLIAYGFEKIFQITHVFRRDERGPRHLPEFSLLEWYRTGATYRKLMEDCEDLVGRAAMAVKKEGFAAPLDISRPFERIPIREAFMKSAGWDPGPDPDPERFDFDLVTQVEPSLSRTRPVFLYDYPAALASLARLKNDDPNVSERAELYLGGIEIANGFTELTDHDEQSRRFREDSRLRKKLGLSEYPWPKDFLQALMHMPPCAGMALGIDRLVMVLTGAQAIDDVVSFVEG